MNTKDLANTYNTIARDYAEDHKNDGWDADFLGFFSEAVSPHGRVLDLGCGPGEETRRLGEQGFDVHGFDLSEALLEIARMNAPKAIFVQGDMLERFPYEENSFDGIFAKASLLHIPKDKIDFVITEIQRVLKPAGVLHIALKQGDGERELAEHDYGYEYVRPFTYWQPEELQNLFATHNLTILKEGVWTNPSTQTVWLKYLLQRES